MFLYYNCSVGKTRNRYFRRASHEGRDEGAKIFQQHRRRKQMKKRVLSAILAVAVLVSVILSVSLPAFAERQIIIDEVGTAMSKSEMQKYVKEFITVATGPRKKQRLFFSNSSAAGTTRSSSSLTQTSPTEISRTRFCSDTKRWIKFFIRTRREASPILFEKSIPSTRGKLSRTS